MSWTENESYKMKQGQQSWLADKSSELMIKDQPSRLMLISIGGACDVGLKGGIRLAAEGLQRILSDYIIFNQSCV